MKPPTVVEFVTDPQLLGLTISPAQETLLRVIYGLPLVTDDQRELFCLCTGRTTYRDGHAFPEVTVLSGARGGKDSRIAAPIVAYEALFGGHERYLHRGERGIIPLVAQDARGAKIAFGYIKELPYQVSDARFDGRGRAARVRDYVDERSHGHLLPVHPAVPPWLVDAHGRDG
jgi:hypothetical protein